MKNKTLFLSLILIAVITNFYLWIDRQHYSRQLINQLEYRKQLEREREKLTQAIRSYQRYLPDNENKPFPEYIEWKIRSMAADHSIDPNMAFAIAVCESTLNPYAKNPNSTAKGLFQFLDGTWEWIKADGSQYDPEEQIRQFMIWYPKNPQWWQECTNKIKR